MPQAASHQITELLWAWDAGEMPALKQLMPLVYGELSRLAAKCSSGARGGQLLQTNALVREAYLRLVDIDSVGWQDRIHFFKLYTRLMRCILARSGHYQKRGHAMHLHLEEALTASAQTEPDILAVDDALQSLVVVDPRKSQIVELRIFGGLTVEETAEVMHLSSETTQRDWRLAKAWLTRELTRDIHHEA